MKLLGLALAVGGWMVAVGGVVATDDLTVRLIAATIGFGTAVAGVLTVNHAHDAVAIWRRKEATR
jgi:hypothetical protein